MQTACHCMYMHKLQKLFVHIHMHLQEQKVTALLTLRKVLRHNQSDSFKPEISILSIFKKSSEISSE